MIKENSCRSLIIRQHIFLKRRLLARWWFQCLRFPLLLLLLFGRIMDSQIMIVEYSWCCNVFVYALMPGIKSRFVRHSAKNLEATPWWISSPKISIFFRILLGERRAKSSSYSKDWRGQLSGSHILLICLICLCKD